jgi:NADH-quinone oxidoreductase subunit M
VTHEENETLQDLQPREWASVVPLCAVAIVMGVFPTIFLKPMEPAVQRLVAQVQSVQPLRVRNDTPNAAMKVQTVSDSSQQRRQVEP